MINSIQSWELLSDIFYFPDTVKVVEHVFGIIVEYL